MTEQNQNPLLKALKAEYFTLLKQESSNTPEVSRQLDILENAVKLESALPVPQRDLKIFGITGKMKHGKDTFFSFVKELHPQVRRVAFADALKKEVADACDVTVDFINANKDVFRPVLQWWGTEFRRGLHGDDYWLRRMDDTLKLLPQGSIVFVTDVRFLNEADYVTGVGGQIVRVVRITDGPRHNVDAHASESEQDQIRPEFTLISSSLNELQSLTTKWCKDTLN